VLPAIRRRLAVRRLPLASRGASQQRL